MLGAELQQYHDAGGPNYNNIMMLGQLLQYNDAGRPNYYTLMMLGVLF